MNKVICPKCEIEMLRSENKFKKDCFWWRCPTPRCDVIATENPNGSFMGTPADKATRELREKTHKVAENIWGKWGTALCDKVAMYNWFKKNTRSHHIGYMQGDELTETIRKMRKLYHYQSLKDGIYNEKTTNNKIKGRG